MNLRVQPRKGPSQTFRPRETLVFRKHPSKVQLRTSGSPAEKEDSPSPTGTRSARAGVGLKSFPPISFRGSFRKVVGSLQLLRPNVNVRISLFPGARK